MKEKNKKFEIGLERMDWENALESTKEQIRQAYMMLETGYAILKIIKEKFKEEGWE